MRAFSVERPDGRVLNAVEDGDPRGVPVVVIHGTPGSRLLFARHVDDARARGIRLISYDRPGYGESSPDERPAIGNSADDVRAIAEYLKLRHIAVWGYSGGGAPAIACAARLPELVVGAACVAGLAPFGAPGLDWFAGMGKLNVDDFELLVRDRTAWERRLESDPTGGFGRSPEEMASMLSTLLSPIDRTALTPEVAGFLFELGSAGVAHGVRGLRDDGLASIAPWGFDLETIRVPVQIWHGVHDRFVPVGHGRYLVDHVPGAEGHIEPNEGHVSLIFGRFPEVHAWLADRF